MSSILTKYLSQEPLKRTIKTLAQVLSLLEWAGSHAQKQKCMASSVTYLGCMINQHGLHLLKEKVRAVQDSPDPKNMSELKSYLRLLTYCSKFLPTMAHVLAPLYKLFRKTSNGGGLRQEGISSIQGIADIILIVGALQSKIMFNLWHLFMWSWCSPGTPPWSQNALLLLYSLWSRI